MTEKKEATRFAVQILVGPVAGEAGDHRAVLMVGTALMGDHRLQVLKMVKEAVVDPAEARVLTAHSVLR